MEFRTDVFDPDSIEALTAPCDGCWWRWLLTGQRLSALMWLTRVSGRLRCGVIRRPLVRVGGVSVPEVFAWQVIRVPGAVAVRFEGFVEFCRVGCGVESVGACAGRAGGPGLCRGAVGAAVGAGDRRDLGGAQVWGGYVPIDPAHPDERIGFVLADAVRGRGDHHRPVGVTGWMATGWWWSMSMMRASGQPSTPLPVPAADDIAYVILHLGTTGTPKGVAITQGNLSALMRSRPGGLAPGGVWTQCHSLAFDFSVWEIFGGAAAWRRVGGGARGGAGSPPDL